MPRRLAHRAWQALALLLVVTALSVSGGLAYAHPSPTPHAVTTSPAPSTPSATPAATPSPCRTVQIYTGEPAPHCAGPDTTPAPVVNPPTRGGGCAPWELKCQLGSAIDTWFTGIATMAIPPVMDLFSDTMLTTPELSSPAMARARGLWTASEVIANTCFVVLVVIGGLLLMSGQAVAPGTAAKDIVTRLLLAFVAANCSRLFVEQAIKFANGLARAFADYGKTNADPHGAAQLMKGWLIGNVTTLGLLSGLVTLVAVVLALFVACGYIMRVTVTMLLVIAAPLALACHALPQTDGLARLWWRALAGMLSIQVAQSLVFATVVVVLTKNREAVPLVGVPGQKGIVDLLLVVCLLYILARIPSWVSKAIWRGALGQSPAGRVARTLFSVLVLRRITSGLHGRPGNGMPPIPPGGFGPPPGGPAPSVGRPPSPAPGPRPAPRAGTWVQPELPLSWPSPRGRQLELPGMPRQRPVPQRGIQLQLPLRQAADAPRRWWQGELPIDVRAEQRPLPLNLPPRSVQPLLFNDFDRGRRLRSRVQDFPPRGAAPPEGRQPSPPNSRQRPRGDHR